MDGCLASVLRSVHGLRDGRDSESLTTVERLQNEAGFERYAGALDAAQNSPALNLSADSVADSSIGTTADKLTRYITDSFLLEPGELTLDTSLINSGIVDSTGIMEIVAFIEETFGLVVDDRELVPENFDSVSALSSYVTSKRPHL